MSVISAQNREFGCSGKKLPLSLEANHYERKTIVSFLSSVKPIKSEIF
jgi:hypothetical protein